MLEPLDAVEQLGVVGQPDAVGVDHHDVDRLGGGVLEDAQELGVDRRLAAGELKHLGAALDRDQPVDRADAFVVAQMNAARPARRVAHRAAQVARGRDLDQADAGVLLVLGAQAAVEGAALVRLDAELRRHLAGQAVLHLVVLRHVGADEILADAVRRAALAEVDPAPLGDDLGRHERQALRAEALGHAQKRVVAQFCHGFPGFHLRRRFLVRRKRVMNTAAATPAVAPITTAKMMPAPPTFDADEAGRKASLTKATRAEKAITTTPTIAARKVPTLSMWPSAFPWPHSWRRQSLCTPLPA